MNKDKTFISINLTERERQELDIVSAYVGVSRSRLVKEGGLQLVYQNFPELKEIVERGFSIVEKK